MSEELNTFFVTVDNRGAVNSFWQCKVAAENEALDMTAIDGEKYRVIECVERKVCKWTESGHIQPVTGEIYVKRSCGGDHLKPSDPFSVWNSSKHCPYCGGRIER